MADARVKEAHLWGRDDLDWYVEPEKCTEQLLTVERFVGRIHDPCCGAGNVVRALCAAGYVATGADLVIRTDPRPGWHFGMQDFLGENRHPTAATGWPNFVFNPPFFRAKGCEAFIRRALDVATGKVCVFTDIKFLAAAGRAKGLFAERPPHRVWIITPRPSCPPGEYLAAGNVAGGGTADWCWLVWSLTEPWSGTTLGWLKDEAAPVAEPQHPAPPMAEPRERRGRT